LFQIVTGFPAAGFRFGCLLLESAHILPEGFELKGIGPFSGTGFTRWQTEDAEASQAEGDAGFHAHGITRILFTCKKALTVDGLKAILSMQPGFSFRQWLNAAYLFRLEALFVSCIPAAERGGSTGQDFAYVVKIRQLSLPYSCGLREWKVGLPP
jgi:hypothetical protein